MLKPNTHVKYHIIVSFQKFKYPLHLMLQGLQASVPPCLYLISYIPQPAHQLDILPPLSRTNRNKNIPLSPTLSRKGRGSR